MSVIPAPWEQHPLAHEVRLAVSLVEEAGELAGRLRREGLSVSHKTGTSDVVTQADHQAESLILERLRAAHPDDAVVGEEGTEHPGTSGRSWVIDPVDGTYNFTRGMDWWCSALALVDQDGEPLLGAVHHTASGSTYVGGPGLGAFRDGAPLDRVDVPLDRACVTTYLHPPFYDAEVGAAFTRAVRGAGTIRMLGSGSMDAMTIAEGRCDVAVQHSVPDWDRYPGAAVIRGAGGLSRQVEAAGVLWHVAGAPTAVGQICAALTGR